MPSIPMSSMFFLLLRSFRLDSTSRNWSPCMSTNGLPALMLCKLFHASIAPIPARKETFVLDFVNDPEEIKASFEPYFKTAQLSGVSDPNVVHDLQSKLDSAGIYLISEIDTFVKAYFSKTGTQKDLQAAIAPSVDRFRGRLNVAKEKRDSKAIDALETVPEGFGQLRPVV